MAYTTINKPSNYFDTKLYTGTGSAQSITGVGFQPDWVWIKKRNPDDSHSLYDVVRGTTKSLRTNGTDAEQTRATTLTSFDADGFTLSTNNEVNASGATFVAWNWKANGTGVSNTSGTITSTVSANTTSGFSIVSWTGNGTGGATIGHGLGVTPKMFIIKERTDVNNWAVYHSSVDVTGDYTLRLDLTDAKTNGNNTNNDTAPTSSLITLGTSSLTNGSSKTYIAYCFAEVKGFSKFGSYVGNGSLDNAFVYTGFKPAMVIIKRSDGANSWTIFDNKRDPFNEVVTHMAPNNTIADDTNNTYNDLDFLSNGFKVREDNDEVGASGGNYIYMAFAEQPLVGTNNVPATAR